MNIDRITSHFNPQSFLITAAHCTVSDHVIESFELT